MQFFNVSAADLQGRLVTPGLIDAHTHAIFAGNRASEFEMRLNGADYEERSPRRAGGSSRQCMHNTRRDLLPNADRKCTAAYRRLHKPRGSDHTGNQVGLRTGKRDTELAHVTRRARDRARLRPVRGEDYLPRRPCRSARICRKDATTNISTKFAFPVLQSGTRGRPGRRRGRILRRASRLQPDQIARVFDEAQGGLAYPTKLHAEQLSQSRRRKTRRFIWRALSADHIEYLDEDGVRCHGAARGPWP